MIYLTGDTHGRFDRIGSFCGKMQTSRDDILIILGDAGINFHAGALDILRKEYLAKLPLRSCASTATTNAGLKACRTTMSRNGMAAMFMRKKGIRISCLPRTARCTI